MYFLAPSAPDVRETRSGLYAPLPMQEALAAGSIVADGTGGYRLSPRFELPGVEVRPGSGGSGRYALRFDAGAYSPELAAAISSAVLGSKVFTPPSQSLSPSRMAAHATGRTAAPSASLTPPTSDELATIRNGHAEGDIEDGELLVLERWDVNNAPDRWGDLRFTSAALAKLAEDFNTGRSRLLYHDHARIIGRIFEAEVVAADREGVSADFIKTKSYHHVRDSNADLLADLRLGILAYDSIGFQGGAWRWRSDEVEVGGERVTRSWLEIDHTDEAGTWPLVALESSLVYLGRMQGAGNSRLAPATPAEPDETTGNEAPPIFLGSA